MRKSACLTVFVPALVLVGCSSQFSADDHDQKITMDQVPAAVRATIQKEAANGTIDQVEKETEDGKMIYSADVTIGGQKYDVDVAPDGTLLQKKMDKEEDHDQDRD